MKTKIVVLLAVIFALPLTAYGWDSNDDRDLEEDFNRSLRDSQRNINQSQREQHLNNLRDAQKRQDRRDAEFHRRQLEQQLLRERIMGQ